MQKYPDFFPVHLVQFTTPNGVILNGYWIGALRPKRVIVWVHGLGSSMFSRRAVAELLAKDLTAVLMFNNRGHDKISSISTTQGKYSKGGSAHEKFEDCVDDIQGALNFARRSGAKNIYIAGHSTGCQKSIYFASKQTRGYKGVILLAPISDFASERHSQGIRALKKAEKVARSYVQKGLKHTLLPEGVWKWPWTADAQRFLDLYTGNSKEEIFTYWDAKRVPKMLRSVKAPILVFLAERDEYADRPAKKIQDWFAEHLKEGDQIAIVQKVSHGFKGGEKFIAKRVSEWIQ